MDNLKDCSCHGNPNCSRCDGRGQYVPVFSDQPTRGASQGTQHVRATSRPAPTAATMVEAVTRATVAPKPTPAAESSTSAERPLRQCSWDRNDIAALRRGDMTSASRSCRQAPARTRRSADGSRGYHAFAREHGRFGSHPKFDRND